MCSSDLRVMVVRLFWGGRMRLRNGARLHGRFSRIRVMGGPLAFVLAVPGGGMGPNSRMVLAGGTGRTLMGMALRFWMTRLAGMG